MEARVRRARSVLRLAVVAAAISAAVTALRLAGELRGWSPAWFSPATGGTHPHGWSWVIGITWLPVLFGPWFAWRLWTLGDRPPSALRAATLAVAGLGAAELGLRLVVPRLPLLPRFLWLAFFPQLVFWTAFTIVLGSLSGGFTTLVLERTHRARA